MFTGSGQLLLFCNTQFQVDDLLTIPLDHHKQSILIKSIEIPEG